MTGTLFEIPAKIKRNLPAPARKGCDTQQSAARLMTYTAKTQSAGILAICRMAEKPLSREEIMARYEKTFGVNLRESAACGRINTLCNNGQLRKAGTTTACSGMQVHTYEIIDGPHGMSVASSEGEKRGNE